ncbi:MAG: helix-turn-helix domain-containing protein [Verrucomicrobiota bacterium]
MTNENTQRGGSWAHQGAMNQSPNPANDRLLKILQASPEVQAEIDQILEGRTPTPQIEQPTGPLRLGMSAAAKFIGCSRATLWRICRAGRLQKVEILPGSFRLRRADLLALAAGKGEVS